MKFWVFLGIFLFADAISGYKILFIFPLNAQNHWQFSQRIIKTLLNRHHEVTCITSLPWPESMPINYTEVLVELPLNLSQILHQKKIGQAQSALSNILLFTKLGKIRAEHILNSPNVHHFLHRNDLSFDIVINEEFYVESLSMFAYQFNAPLITISSHGYFDFFDRQSGLLTPWSHVSHPLLGYSDNMSFFQRLQNTFVSFSDLLIRNWIHLPNQMKLARKHFSHLGELPTMDKLVKSVSVILINMNRFYLPPRPSMPGIVYIGGAHIEEQKPLPVNLEKFMDGAEDGVIFVNFGTFEMPTEQMDIFLDVLGHLKQRILWNYHVESIPNIPSNVMIHKLLPQNDILAHPRTILFINHGDMSHKYESIQYGVPMLIISLFGDEFGNAKLAERAGYAKQLHYNELNSDSLMSCIEEMTLNKSYSNEAKYMSSIFNDNLVSGMTEAIWWIEHVAKFQGAKHLKSHAINMSLFSYLLLDQFCVFILWSVVAAILMYFLIKFVIKVISERKRQKRLKLY
ncbi:UDP-glucuronosyltransferase 1-10-like [Contarinia nasturtii]|uniref:UDP-glucuronosyltransferase 1-10-like n=1 Tax=Contarinia nasturtii TaxID=265458 RepID=UPI0012D48AEC|nr:UDP-glucuronosyltransferase 1-10-like [Contarinia nasturtii]